MTYQHYKSTYRNILAINMKIDGPAIEWKQIQFDWIKFRVTRGQDVT